MEDRVKGRISHTLLASSVRVVVVLQSYSGSEQFLWRMNGVVDVIASSFSFGIKTQISKQRSSSTCDM